MNELILVHYMVLKVESFNGTQDHMAHLNIFRTQMLISVGNDGVRCKMFVSMFVTTTLEWFNHLPDGSIHAFKDFSKVFGAHFVVNRIKPLQLCNGACSMRK